ncbi:hypothetical protein JZ751_025849, partial [Albula glossodonta]
MQLFTGLVLTVCFCFSSGDEVTQTSTLKEETEGNQVTLECSYKTQSSYATLYWYRQYPGSAPQYILHRGYYTGTAEFAEGRFDASVANGKTVLTISRLSPEDTAIYYCALGTHSFSSGDEVTQTTTPKEETEGNRVTLECSYNTQSSYATLYWYRQYPGSAPQYILHRGYYTGTAEFAEGRFDASAANGKT